MYLLYSITPFEMAFEMAFGLALSSHLNGQYLWFWSLLSRGHYFNETGERPSAERATK